MYLCIPFHRRPTTTLVTRSEHHARAANYAELVVEGRLGWALRATEVALKWTELQRT